MGHEITAWPGARLMESEIGAPQVRTSPRPRVYGPGHSISEDREAYK